ncbi:MAG: hypothetical protein IJE10_06835 [Clostridia bacterium]|nr:hypothetical protein [Clostridia bacterium]
MILIRGIKGETYARKIEKGIVDCRDILSALLKPPVTGYEYSDYYEKNLVKALTNFTKKDAKELHSPQFLYSILIDYFIPHIYLTYFHVLNERSLEWLDKFDDDYQFIALNVKLDRNTHTMIGNEFFGAKMSYVDSISTLSQDGFKDFHAACMCSIENLFTNIEDMLIPLQIYNTLSFALLCREQDEKFTDIENEFRLIAYDCPRIQNGIMQQKTREVTVLGKSGIEYKGVLNAGKNSFLKSNLCVLKDPYKLLYDILIEEQGMVTLNSQFKSINIRDIADEYVYLGGKIDCKNYIEKMVNCRPKDIYVDKTVIRKYKKSDIPDAKFAPSYQKVEY